MKLKLFSFLTNPLGAQHFLSVVPVSGSDSEERSRCPHPLSTGDGTQESRGPQVLLDPGTISEPSVNHLSARQEHVQRELLSSQNKGYFITHSMF